MLHDLGGELPTNLIVYIDQVVSDGSAIIGNAYENRGTIHADHIGMVKFSTREDTGYKRVLDAIERLLEDQPNNKLAPANQNVIGMSNFSMQLHLAIA
jgi:hypothetical protein